MTRLQDFTPLPDSSVWVTGLRPGGLWLAGATPDGEGKMRAWRRALSIPFGYRHKEHDPYRYHMTFSYTVD